MTTRQRIDLLARAYPRLFPRAELLRLVRSELGVYPKPVARSATATVDALDGWILREGVRVRARAPKLIYHICAGNLAISAMTSIVHGLVLGSQNVVKLPSDREDSSARREILNFIRGLPAPLRKLVEIQKGSAVQLGNEETLRLLRDGGARLGSRASSVPPGRSALLDALPGTEVPGYFQSSRWDEEAAAQADVVIAFGSDATMESLRARTRFDQKFIAHGHAVSLLWLGDPNRLTAREARGCATDVLTYDQLGCLSPQAIYVPPRTDVAALGEKLSRALEAHWSRLEKKPARPLGVAARIAEARDMAFALGHRVWLPPGKHLGWTLIHEAESFSQPSPLHGFITIRSVGEARLGKALASVAGKISTVGVVGTLSTRAEAAFLKLGVTRFCPAGRMQFPPLTWHHDGRSTLADLVTWVDAEGGGSFFRRD
jgi:hypothetical protein